MNCVKLLIYRLLYFANEKMIRQKTVSYLLALFVAYWHQTVGFCVSVVHLETIYIIHAQRLQKVIVKISFTQ